MKRALGKLGIGILGTTLACGLSGCDNLPGASGSDAEETGSIEVALLAAPADAACLRLSAAGTRTVTKLFPLVPGASTVFTLDRLPVGIITVDGAAFPVTCAAVTATTLPNWMAEAPVQKRIDPLAITSIILKLIRNGRLSVTVDFESPPWVSSSTAPIDIAVIGDSPYGAVQIPDFPALVSTINGDARISQVVHLGDIKNGSSRCDTTYFQLIAGYFSGFSRPLVYTPGDNEWTDCHRANNGAYDPLERLAVLRSTFYPVPGLAIGGGRKEMLSQSSLGGFETLVENNLWFEASVAFATLHLVGSNNGLLPWFGDDTTGTKADDPARRLAEVAAREAAALDWMDRTFALATSQNAVGVVLMMQADTWPAGASTPPNGFTGFVQRLAALSRAFARPVLVLQGDTHVYRADTPLAAGDPARGVTTPVPNVARVVVQGETTSEWLRLHVDPAATAAPFTWQRMPR